jgi:protein TIF31
MRAGCFASFRVAFSLPSSTSSTASHPLRARAACLRHTGMWPGEERVGSSANQNWPLPSKINRPDLELHRFPHLKSASKIKRTPCSFTFPSFEVDFKGKSTMAEGNKPAEPAPEAAPETSDALVETDVPVEASVLKNLVILPPLQKKGASSRDELLDAVPLPPIRAEEPVSSIRAALSEIVGYAHLTNYRFVLEETVEAPTTDQRKPFIVSPYTGPNAVVSVPTAIKSLEKEPQVIDEKSLVLDDYGDLTSLLESGLQDGSAFRVVLERYDTALVRDHVGRLRSLLEGNAPSATSLDEGGGAAEQPEGEQAETAAEDTKPDDATSEPKKEEEKSREEKNKEAAAAKEKAQKEAAKDLAKYPVGKSVALDGNNLKDFFYLACGEDPALYTENAVKNANSKKENGSKKSKKKNKKHKEEDEETEAEEPSSEKAMREVIPRLNELEEKTRVKCTIRLSGFHPPPPSRRLMGDLSYLEVSLPGEKDIIHITAIPTGFYVNHSSSANGVPKFDPSPAVKPCFSHELLDCLLLCSAPLSTAWEEAMIASKERAHLMAALNKDGPFSSLFRVAIRGDFKGYKNPSTASAAEGIDALIQSPTWLVPIPKAEEQSLDSWTHNSVHKYNPARTEDELSNSFGVDIRSGAVRDWNEELQSAREMSMEFLPQRIERARLVLLCCVGAVNLLYDS